MLVRIAGQLADTFPGESAIEADPEPATWPDIRRHEEVPGLLRDVHFLQTCGSRQPQGDAPVPVVVDHVGCKGLAARDPEIRRPV